MSKAFTREDDDRPEEIRPRRAPLPAQGGRVLLTARGAARFREELRRLREERSALQATIAKGAGGAGEAQERLSRGKARMEELQQTLVGAEVLGAPPKPHDTVQFGATVTVRDVAGGEVVYRIVGVDEADGARDEVSYLSPIARALLNARLGQRVVFRFPRGEQELEIVRIAYVE
ncbi:MAG: GreA/GreB family elongation factor [Verrucomicrobia bacterium]|nr:GreA/GreB family elongation factor [Verrucomicrobiota bacterium]